MDRILEISSVFVDLFNSIAGAANPITEISIKEGNNSNLDDDSVEIPSHLRETTEDYIQKMLTACNASSGAQSSGSQQGIRVNEFKPNLDWLNCEGPLLFQKHLRGKLVLLHFWTYCCVNCQHMIPILEKLEKKFTIEQGLVIISVHSAKFTQELLSGNIQHAVKKYGIKHPVVNDTESTMWNDLACCCWPTCILVGPLGEPMLVVQGEQFHSKLLQTFISSSLEILKAADLISNHRIKELQVGSQYSGNGGKSTVLPTILSPFLYPGKVTATVCQKNSGNRNQGNSEILMAISDSGHHRIIVCNIRGHVKHVIGGGHNPNKPSAENHGFQDGGFREVLFKNPQGLCFGENQNILYVADTDNHAIRAIDLKLKTVKTIAGNGRMLLPASTDFKSSAASSNPNSGLCPFGGAMWTQQCLNTPWDVLYVDRLRAIIIAMAGTHQLWALFLDKTTQGTNKSKWCGKGLCVCVAGSGKEENRNNSYNALRASFAQPSGLCLAVTGGSSGYLGYQPQNEGQPPPYNYHQNLSIFVADAESSTVRRVYLDTGSNNSSSASASTRCCTRVLNVCGGSPDPTDLFSYGDIDGPAGTNSRLQHPMAVAWNRKKNTLYVADTYNNKVKCVTGIVGGPIQNQNSTDPGSNAKGNVHALPLPVKLNEPNGLYYIESGNGTKRDEPNSEVENLLLIANTNSHNIYIYNFNTYVIKKLQLEFPLIYETKNVVGNAHVLLSNNGNSPAQLMVRGKVSWPMHGLNEDNNSDSPPLKWILQLPDNTWESKEIKSAANDFKYLIRIPVKQREEKEIEVDNERDDDLEGENGEGSSDEDPQLVILRCETSICTTDPNAGSVCLPVQFDFVVEVRFSNSKDAPLAADAYFPYTVQVPTTGLNLNNSKSLVTLNDNCEN
ncbi:NHL repeat-containing protein 2 [Daktulosphaira vitifoliae]|uniref:NHL repeat-containing protein 2 n=1 Tax=Daktulosphaira vitifoliae TaxID=58002 RepID=UPI0021AAE153|nr:NHL repeat-containing protein 2 [Daktulosphaira vitifoliae]